MTDLTGDCANATTTNTDTINITGSAVSDALNLGVPGAAASAFAPGMTDEAGTTDEIEFSVNLGGGFEDAITLPGDGDVQRVRLGSLRNQPQHLRRGHHDGPRVTSTSPSAGSMV